MRVLGVDLAARATSTGVVVVEPTKPGRWHAVEPAESADDDALVRAAHGVEVLGVDAPIGWPVGFVEAVAAHNAFGPWPGTDDRSMLTHRDTDRAVQERSRRLPLSVSADRLGSVAMRCALLQRRWADEVWGRPAARDGTDALVETYPAAAFVAWEIDCRGYKSRQHPEEARPIRERIVESLDTALSGWLDLTPIRTRCAESDHVLDALMCALVAVACKSGATHAPDEERRSTARVEGWIHVPAAPLTALRPSAA